MEVKTKRQYWGRSSHRFPIFAFLSALFPCVPKLNKNAFLCNQGPELQCLVRVKEDLKLSNDFSGCEK